jgi:hypothetical protein
MDMHYFKGYWVVDRRSVSSKKNGAGTEKRM